MADRPKKRESKEIGNIDGCNLARVIELLNEVGREQDRSLDDLDLELAYGEDYLEVRVSWFRDMTDEEIEALQAQRELTNKYRRRLAEKAIEEYRKEYPELFPPTIQEDPF